MFVCELVLGDQEVGVLPVLSELGTFLRHGSS